MEEINKLLNEWKQKAHKMKTGNYGWGIDDEIRDYKLEQLEECIEDLENAISKKGIDDNESERIG